MKVILHVCATLIYHLNSGTGGVTRFGVTRHCSELFKAWSLTCIIARQWCSDVTDAGVGSANYVMHRVSTPLDEIGVTLVF